MPTGSVKRSTLAARLMASLLMMNVALFGFFGGVQQFLLPVLIDSIAPGEKVEALAVLSALGATAAAVANPLAGHWSDGLRSRWGRRAPWVVLGSLVAVAGLLVLGGAPSLFVAGASYAVAMFALGSVQAILSALIPEEIPQRRRATAVALISVSMTVGPFLGISLLSGLGPLLGVGVLGSCLVAISCAHFLWRFRASWIVRAPVAPERATPSTGGFFSSLSQRDFRWLIISRAILMTGFWAVMSYQFFMLTDYVGRADLPAQDPALSLTLLTGCNAVAAVIASLLTGPLADRFPVKRWLMIASCLGVGGGYLALVVSPNWTGIIVFAVLNGVFFSVFSAMNQAIATIALPNPATAARDLGLLNISATVPQIVGPLVGAAVIGGLGWEWMLVGAAVVSFLAAVASVRVSPSAER